MRTLTVISGKGGTGKTMLTASFAVLAKNKVMVDCDVDAANLHLLLHPQIVERHNFNDGTVAVIDLKKCHHCGRCLEACRFEAIDKYLKVDPIACEGCGLCRRICPPRAITMLENSSGEYFFSRTKYGPFFHAKLGIAQGNSGKLVAKIRAEAKALAERSALEYIIVDGPPGIGCPVIASLSGADLALVVTEPTLSGRHDLERVLEINRQLKIKTQVVINKYDLNPENSRKTEEVCREKNIAVAGTIPFSADVPRAIVQGVPPVAFADDKVAAAITRIWSNIEKAMEAI